MTCYRVHIEQFVSSCIYIHGYNPSYLTIDIIYDVSLSQIDVVSAEKHIFKIDELNIVIYNEDELNIIKENIKDYVLNQTFSKNIKLDLKTAIANTKKKTHTKIIDGTKETYVKINENYSEPLDSIYEDIKELKKEIKELEKEIKSKNV